MSRTVCSDQRSGQRLEASSTWGNVHWLLKLSEPECLNVFPSPFFFFLANFFFLPLFHSPSPPSCPSGVNGGLARLVSICEHTKGFCAWRQPHKANSQLLCRIDRNYIDGVQSPARHRKWRQLGRWMDAAPSGCAAPAIFILRVGREYTGAGNGDKKIDTYWHKREAMCACMFVCVCVCACGLYLIIAGYNLTDWIFFFNENTLLSDLTTGYCSWLLIHHSSPFWGKVV